MSERARVCSSCASFGLFADTTIKWRCVRDERKEGHERKRVLRVHAWCTKESVIFVVVIPLSKPVQKDSNNTSSHNNRNNNNNNNNNKTNTNVSSFNEKIHHRECSQQQYQQHFFIIDANVFLVRVLHLHDDEGKKQL